MRNAWYYSVIHSTFYFLLFWYKIQGLTLRSLYFYPGEMTQCPFHKKRTKKNLNTSGTVYDHEAPDRGGNWGLEYPFLIRSKLYIGQWVTLKVFYSLGYRKWATLLSGKMPLIFNILTLHSNLYWTEPSITK